MMKKTDKHFRFMARQFTKNSMLYTEMIHSNAILKGDADKLLKYHNSEHPVGLQLGGSDPRSLAEAAIIGEDYGYDEINLNVGCPSKKVKSGNFGVFLMKNVELLSSCINEVKKSINTPFTIKCRIGVDDFEGEKYLENFLSTISDYGITTFIIHARKAISGLDTKRNRSIPPLIYDEVYKIKQNYPDTEIILNGGISSYKEINDHLANVDGVMLGRKVYSDPSFLLSVDKKIYNEQTLFSIDQALMSFMEYILKLENKKDANRAIGHLMQFIKSLSIEKQKRKILLDELNNKNVELTNVFKNFTQDYQKNLSLNL